MRKVFLLPFLLVIMPFTGFAQDEIDRGYIDVTIAYKAMSPGTLQIRDGVCKPPRDIECEKARIKVAGEKCQQKPMLSQCVEARELLGSPPLHRRPYF